MATPAAISSHLAPGRLRLKAPPARKALHHAPTDHRRERPPPDILTPTDLITMTAISWVYYQSDLSRMTRSQTAQPFRRGCILHATQRYYLSAPASIPSSASASLCRAVATCGR